MKINISTIFSFVCLLISLKAQEAIGFGWNSFITSNNNGNVLVEEAGIKNWKDNEVTISIYFYVNNPGKMNLKLQSASN